MPDWIADLVGRGLLTETQARELRVVRDSGVSHRARPAPAAAEPELGPAEEAGTVLACTACGVVYTGAGASACPRCKGRLRPFRLGGPIVRDGAPSPSPPPGRTYGRYRLRREIGRGGMGVVWEAWDTRLQRRVALKMLAGTTEELDAEAVERFRREALAAARLNHPAIVGVLDVGFVEGRHFLTMDFIEGASMHDRLYAGDAAAAFPMAQRIGVLETVASALATAHAAGIVHRDLKPSNILIAADGRAFLTDFGLAHDARSGGLARLTVTGSLIGTLEFMSPEQVEPGRGAVGPPADVFSFGVVMYLALTGEMPVDGETLPSLAALSGKMRPRPSARNPRVPAHLDELCERCLQADPERRPRDGGELVAALTPSPRRAISRRARAGWAAGALVAAFALGALARGGRRAAAPAASVPAPAPGEAAAAPTPPTPARESPRAHLDSARASLDRAPAAGATSGPDLTAADSLAGRALQLDPKCVEAMILRAEAAWRLGRVEPALASLRDALRLEPGSTAAAFALAWHGLVLRVAETLAPGADPFPFPADPDAARVFGLAAAGAAGLSEGDAACAGAAVALEKGDRARALMEARSARGRGAGWRALWLEGVLTEGPGSAAALAEACRLAPGSALLRAATAAAILRLQPPADAEADLEAALHLDPGCVPALHVRAFVRRAAAPAAARRDLDAALAAAPEFVPALRERGLLLLELKETAAALRDLDRLCSLRPRFVPAFRHAARARAVVGDWGSAALDWDVVIAAEPGDAAAWLGRGEARARLGRRAEALEDALKAIALAPAVEDAHVLRVGLLEGLGRRADAIAAADEALGHCPESGILRLARAGYLAAEQKFEAATRDAEEAARLRPDDPAVHRLLLALYWRAGDWKGELEEAQWLLRAEAGDQEALYWSGVARSRLGQTAEAIADFERLLQLAPADSAWRLQAEVHLDSLRRRTK